MTLRHRSAAVLFGALVVCGLVGSGCSSSSSSTTPVDASGSVHCTSVVGSVDFTPPLTSSGTGQETATVRVNLEGCSTSGSNVSKVTSGFAISHLVGGVDACSGLVNSRRLTIDTKWSPSGIEPSVVVFSGFSVTTNSSGHSGFAFPGAGHTATVTGSFAGSDMGASSTASVYADAAASQLLSACSQPSGLASIPIASGDVTLG